jgi:hypothetical protein
MTLAVKVTVLQSNTTVYLLHKQLHVSAIERSYHQAVYKNKMKIFSVVSLQITKAHTSFLCGAWKPDTAKERPQQSTMYKMEVSLVNLYKINWNYKNKLAFGSHNRVTRPNI